MKKKQARHNKWKFVATFCVAMLLFAAIRHVFTIQVPMLAMTDNTEHFAQDRLTEVYVGSDEADEFFEEESDEALPQEEETLPQEEEALPQEEEALPQEVDVMPHEQGRSHPHRIMGVHSWDACFPDINDVQLVAAQENGIQPVRCREDLHQLIVQHRLVNICHSPYYAVDDLTHSMPYLVPKAQHLLNTICLNFIDSLQMKGLPVHLPMVTSVLRTADDVSRLQRGNGNATTNSCHCYGTTVDITYNRFVPLVGYYNPNTPLLRWNEKMKQVLAEVLNDLRQQGLCYVKYERKQACFHLTVR